MPRPHPPPTPGSSSDLRGRESAHINAPAFHLPPAAYENDSAASSAHDGSDSSYQASPTSPVIAARKRPNTQSSPVITREDYTLPPPPTRSRKIIQMKPRDTDPQLPSPQISAQTAAVASPQSAPKQAVTGPTGGKRKQANAGTTAAGRKIARKTAHSLIERRRRSKMNEEFGVLKDMIPACRGQEMHKLAILQASIEYLRYLEQCVSDLQAQSGSATAIPPPPASATSRSDRIDEEDEDEEMEDDHEPAPHRIQPVQPVQRSGSLVSLPPLSQITSTNTTSPSVFSAGGSRHYSISSATSLPSYSPLYPSNQTSPAFGPQIYHRAQTPGFGLGLGSPALEPQDSSAWHLRQIAESATERAEKQFRAAPSSSSLSSTHAPLPLAKAESSENRTEHELDQEATAALLMLNHDRRNWRQEADTTTRSTAGMSVKDLLSG